MNAAGRTDRGVSAYGQVVSFYSWEELALDDIITCINAADPGKLRALHAQVVPRSFHATFQVSPPKPDANKACPWKIFQVCQQLLITV